MSRVPLGQYLEQVRERMRRFRQLGGVHLPLYESHAGIDFGHYLCYVRSRQVWSQQNPVPDGEEQEAQAALAEHLVLSVQDAEELVEACTRLRLENMLLRNWLKRAVKTEKIDNRRGIA